MFNILINAWKTPELRKKILFTLFIILVFRIGSAVPVPFLSSEGLKGLVEGSNSIFDYLDLMTGGNFSRANLFALSITPYINASIIMQLLTVIIPALERLSKAGEEGKKKINKITRYLTAGIAVALGIGYYFILQGAGSIIYRNGTDGLFTGAVIVMAFAAGAMLVTWLGDQISDRGVGNGISVILFAGILSRVPAGITYLYSIIILDTVNIFLAVLVIILFALVIYFIVVMTTAERKIPIQYAKKVVGRKMYGGQSSHIPIKVTLTGVLPVIFAGAILAVPSTLAIFIGQDSAFGTMVAQLFSTRSLLYGVMYFLLIIAFNYFYVAMQYNPIEIANNLRKNSGAIPGIRPGRPTSEFIKRILSKITLIGAVFLGCIALGPIIFTAISGLNIAIGGTSVLIVVGVALETSKTLESQLMMRHYKGFLE